MEAEKVRNLSDTELAQTQRDQMDQLFRLKFQMKMGQTESLNKIRSLRRGVARLKTIARERALGIGHAAAGARKTAKTAKAEVKAVPAAKAAGAAKTKKKAAKKSAAKTASAKSKAAGKKSGKR